MASQWDATLTAQNIIMNNCSVHNKVFCTRSSFSGMLLAISIIGIICGAACCFGSLSLMVERMALSDLIETISFYAALACVVVCCLVQNTLIILSIIVVIGLERHPFRTAAASRCKNRGCTRKEFASYTGSNCTMNGEHATMYEYAVDAATLTLCVCILLAVSLVWIIGAVLSLNIVYETKCAKFFESSLQRLFKRRRQRYEVNSDDRAPREERAEAAEAPRFDEICPPDAPPPPPAAAEEEEAAEYEHR